jgi:hypothetical protein
VSTISPNGFLKCLEVDLNHRHEDFQSSALPTELSKLKMISTYIFKYKLKKKLLYSIGVDVSKSFLNKKKKNTSTKNKLRFIFYKRFYKKLY